MSNEELVKQAAVTRLMADIRAAKVELLSAQCAADRLRMQYSIADIVSFGERQSLKGAIASADALSRFFGSIAEQIKKTERRK
jgi:hypothetical protein